MTYRAQAMEGRAICARTVALLASHTDLRRLRIAYRSDPQVYQDLLLLSVIALAGTANGTEIAVTDTPNRSSEMTTAEAATAAGVQERTIRRAITEHRITATKRAGRWWITPEALATYRTGQAARQEKPCSTEPPANAWKSGYAPSTPK